MTAHCLRLPLVVVFVLVTLALGWSHADQFPSQPPASAYSTEAELEQELERYWGSKFIEPTPAIRKYVEGVFQKLVAKMEKPQHYQTWPPEVRYVEACNMAATVCRNKEGVPTPTIIVGVQMLDKHLLGEDPNMLAMGLGHELGHLNFYHTRAAILRAGKEGAVVTYMAKREQELEADAFAKELLQKAEFSFQTGKRAYWRLRDNLRGQKYSSFEGYSHEHPSWNDRLGHIDRHKANYYRAMSAFQSGVSLLEIRSFTSAAAAFTDVAREYPSCFEAQLNLGYAYLMAYLDTLEANDLRDLHLAYLIAGGFYRSSEALNREETRGDRKELWQNARLALLRALDLNPNSALAKAHLGLACLVDPSGANVGEAERYLTEAAQAAASDPTLKDPILHATLQLNLGATYLTAGQSEQFLVILEKSERLLNQGLEQMQEEARVADLNSLFAAMDFNRALLLSARKDTKDRTQALTFFRDFLKKANPRSAWWKLGYEKYQQLAKELGHAAAPAEDLGSLPTARTYRQVTDVLLPGGQTVAIGESVASVRTKLGTGKEQGGYSRITIKRLVYPDLGVELLVTDTVQAIILKGKQAPKVALRHQDVAAGTGTVLEVGMNEADFAPHRKALGFHKGLDVHVAGRNFEHAPQLGIAVHFTQGEKTIDEIVITQVPSGVAQRASRGG